MSDLIDLKLLARCAPSPHHSSDDVDDLIASSDLDPETVVPPHQDDSDEELDIEALKFSHPLLKMDDDFFVPHIENSPLSNDEVRNIVRQLCNYQRQDFMSLRSKLTFEERIDSFFGWATPILVMAGHQQPRKVLVSLAHHLFAIGATEIGPAHRRARNIQRRQEQERLIYDPPSPSLIFDRTIYMAPASKYRPETMAQYYFRPKGKGKTTSSSKVKAKAALLGIGSSKVSDKQPDSPSSSKPGPSSSRADPTLNSPAVNPLTGRPLSTTVRGGILQPNLRSHTSSEETD
ncbi:hypothetical protein V8E36_001275 [Tilletia maclaganii]